MKLKDWMEFNHGLLNCGDFIVKVLKTGSMKKDDILFTTVARKEVCEKFFGDFEIAKYGIGRDTYPHSEQIGIRFLLWADMEEN